MFKLLIAATLLISSYPAPSYAEMSALEIMKRNFAATKPGDSESLATINLINKEGKKRVRKVRGYSKLVPSTTDNRRLAVFEYPKDVKGTKTLMVENSGKDDDFWIFLPALKKVRRLVASNKRDSFAGTDFSYGDVLGHKPEEWTHKTLREEEFGGVPCYVIESKPKSKTISENTGYSKRLHWVDKESFMARKIISFDQRGKELKVTTQEKFQKVDAKKDIWHAFLQEAKNSQTGHKTVIEYESFKVNVGVGEDQFTIRRLEKLD